jgi:hypothetical protein
VSLEVAVAEFLALIDADGKPKSREEVASAGGYSGRDYELAVAKLRDELAAAEAEAAA